ncbi:hypothetical protein [Acinetobacter sp. SA01]|uniref:hypothetical protein n=1 Tax=Acinetobacter sp. SA01 TaxID=1862567 RepID=UPI00140DF954|nr:hypothetical protein [Acinetobacter sp. SA01]
MNSAEINYVFDELISKYQQLSNSDSNHLIEYLQKTKNKEHFIADIFRSKGVMVQKSKLQEGVDFSEPENEYIPVFKFRPTTLAKKWFPYEIIFESFDVNKEEGFDRYELSIELVKFLRIINKYVRGAGANFTNGKASISDILLFEAIDNRIGQLKFEELSLAELQLVEKILCVFIEELEKPMIKNYLQYERARFNKKIREYKSYIQNLLNNFGDLYAVSINFWWDGHINHMDSQKNNQKKQFFNNLRSYPDFEAIKGHVGLWEYSDEKGLYFRCIFFCANSKKYNKDSLIEGLLRCWEQAFALKSNGRLTGKVIYSAELSHLAYTKSKSLNQPITLLSQNNKVLLEEFYNIVLNYIIISEKYYYPLELQMELLVLSPVLKQGENKNEDKGFILKKYGPSRSFRGHLRKPKN